VKKLRDDDHALLALEKVRFSRMPTPGRRDDRSDASAERGGYSYVFA
jgi:hypothetical protein